MNGTVDPKRMEKTEDDRRALVLWLALALSGSVHVLLYLVPWTLPAPVGRPVIDRTRSVVFMDAVGNGEASGEPAGEALAASAGPGATTPSDARPATPESREPREASVRRPRRPPVPPAAAPSTAPTPPTATETPQPETAESAMTEREPETSETTEATALPPSELANQLFLEELMRRAPLPGLGGSGGATGSGSGAGAGGSGCADPILGTWRARRYDLALGRHVVFTLRLTERQGSRVEGTILNRSWSGGRSQRSPPRCAPGVSDHTVTMPARGRLVGDSFRLDALSHRRTNHCFDEGLWMYNLDHFTGTVEGDTFRAVNNDGGHERNSPYTFERISCH